MNRIQAIDYIVAMLEHLCVKQGIEKEFLLDLKKIIEERDEVNERRK